MSRSKTTTNLTKKGGRGFTPPCTPLNVSVPISYLEKYSDKTLRKPLTKRMFGVLLLLYLSKRAAIKIYFFKLNTGRNRFYDNMESMLGFRINPWIGWCWCFFAPSFCAVS